MFLILSFSNFKYYCNNLYFSFIDRFDRVNYVLHSKELFLFAEKFIVWSAIQFRVEKRLYFELKLTDFERPQLLLDEIWLVCHWC